MRILHVMAGANHGGAETAFVDMCVAMKEEGHDIYAATRSNSVRVKQLQKASIPVFTLPFGGLIDIYTPWKLASIVRDIQPDIVQTWMARAAQKIPDRNFVRSQKPYAVVSRLGGYYKIKNFKNTGFFATITPDIKRHLIDHGVESERVRHINNFAETEDVTIPVNRSDLDTPEDAPVLLTLARLHESKAYDVVLDSLKDLPGFYLWIAGEGPLRDTLERQARDLGVSERVRFLGWRTDRAALLDAVDICLFCSRYEPFGTVFVQAWAAKTPVIVSDADGPKQFCKHEQDSLIVPKNDTKALSQAVQRLWDDKNLQNQCIDNGYQRYLNEFTKEKTVEAYIKYYKEILAQIS